MNITDLKHLSAAHPPPLLTLDTSDGLPLIQDVTTETDPVVMTNFQQFIASVSPDASQRSRVQHKFWLDARQFEASS